MVSNILSILVIGIAIPALGAAPDGRETIAVQDFSPSNASATDAVTITGFVRRAMVRTKKYRVVEKSNMDKILAVQAFQQTGCTDAECAVKLGKILNARKVVVGEYAVMEGMKILTASLVDVETGEIEQTGEVKGFDVKGASDAASQLVAQLTGVAVAAPQTPVVRAEAPSAVPSATAGPPAAEITGRDGAPMVLIPAGEFMMGSEKGIANEKPVHKAYLDAFYIDKYEVTFDRYDAFCDATGRTKPSDAGWGRGTRPVINVSWDDSKAYCAWAGKRLPTEAEWERACRAGTDTAYSFGDDAGLLGSYGWYLANSGNMTHPVGEKNPNAFGLYDMHGNVWEWVADWYDSGYYSVSPLSNPSGPASGTYRVLRGGSWDSTYDDYLRSGIRSHDVPAYSYYSFGCRCARTP